MAHADVNLISALMDGQLETPQWSTFTRCLRDRTGADHATLSFRRPGRPWGEMVLVDSGAKGRRLGEKLYLRKFFETPPGFNEHLQEGRPYRGDEWLNILDPTGRDPRRLVFEHKGVRAFREMLVREPSGLHGWMSLTREQGDFSPSQEKILVDIAPLMRKALQNFVLFERNKPKLYGDILRRGQLSPPYMTLDRSGLIIYCDDTLLDVVANSRFLTVNSQQRLCARPALLERRIYDGIDRVATQKSRFRVIRLQHDPPLDMLLLKAERTSIYSPDEPEVIAYIQADSWQSVDRTEQVAELFGLAPREARLAMAFCRGMTIAEAAEAQGLSIETARNYSKALYSKTGARGMANLVRLITCSILTMIPA